MERMSKAEMTALLALLGITASGVAQASPIKTSDNHGAYLVAEKNGAKKGAAAACGKGSCGVDTKGAKTAKEKHTQHTTQKVKSVKKKPVAK